MSLYRRLRRWRPGARRLRAAGVLLAYALAALGVPLPVPTKDGRPFPCQHHQCGCRTANQCWRSCCCFSVEERLAWARNEKIEPPAFVQAAATQGWHTVRQRDRESCPHCANHAAKPVAKEDRSCCSQTAQTGNKPTSSGNGGATWVVLSAFRCQGQGVTSLWLGVGAILPPTGTTWKPREINPGWLAYPDHSASPFSMKPPEPPPRA